MITLNTTKFYAYILSSLMLFMVALIMIPQMYSAKIPVQAFAAAETRATDSTQMFSQETVVLHCEIR